LPEHERAGARLTHRPEAPDALTVLTYGDVPAEYEAGTRGCLLLDASDRGALRVAGSDAASFLHRLLSQHVEGLPPGAGNPALLLSAKGRVLHEFDLFREEAGALLGTSPGETDAAVTALDNYLFSEDVTLEAVDDRHAPLELLGPASASTLGTVIGEVPDLDDHAWLEREWSGRSLHVARVVVAGSRGWRVDGGPEAALPLWQALVAAGAEPGGIVARDILRVEAGAALLGVDVDENVYPQEARLEGAFALDKGCFVGQEVVAKIDTYGGLNKRLVGLRLSDDEPVARGTRLLLREDGEPRDLGMITTWAYSFVLDGGLALGYVKRRHQEAGTAFELEGSAARATIVDLPVREDAVRADGRPA